MNRTVSICDLCGTEIDSDQYVKPDGRGGLINLYTKYPRALVAHFHEKSATPQYDLCIDCSMKISRFMRSIWWEAQKKEARTCIHH